MAPANNQKNDQKAPVCVCAVAPQTHSEILKIAARIRIVEWASAAR